MWTREYGTYIRASHKNKQFIYSCEESFKYQVRIVDLNLTCRLVHVFVIIYIMIKYFFIKRHESIYALNFNLSHQIKKMVRAILFIKKNLTYLTTPAAGPATSGRRRLCLAAHQPNLTTGQPKMVGHGRIVLRGHKSGYAALCGWEARSSRRLLDPTAKKKKIVGHSRIWPPPINFFFLLPGRIWLVGIMWWPVATT